MPVISVSEQIECALCRQRVAETAPLGNAEVCHPCAHEHDVCEHCDTPARSLHATDEDTHVCADCSCYYALCTACELFSRHDMYVAESEPLVCDDCARHDFWFCDDCTILIDAGNRCSDCAHLAEHDDDTGELIQSYSYQPPPVFHGDGPVFLGLELELDTPFGRQRDCAEHATQVLGSLGYLKEDCSIDHGFELVTHPMSYAWALDGFPWTLLGQLGNAGCDASANGLHVHISRAGLSSAAHTYRWMQFLYRNAPGVIRIARRDCPEWAAFGASARRNLKNYAKGSRYGPRYQAINTQPENTFELRVFAGSLDPADVQCALGLAAASVEYTRRISAYDILHSHAWEWDRFADWVAQRPEYGPLAEQLGGAACAC